MPAKQEEKSDPQSEGVIEGAIIIAGKKFLLGECPEQDKQLLKLKKIVEKEQGHC